MTSPCRTHRRKARCGLVIWLCAALVAGCASKGPMPPADTSATGLPAPPADGPGVPNQALSVFEARQRGAADAAERGGRWLEAAWYWDVLLALNPGDTESQRRRAAALQTAQTTAADRLVRAQQARTRGDAESAQRLYLEVLANAPADVVAADALRAIERDRIKRQHLGQLSRNTLTRRNGYEQTMPATAMSPSTTPNTDRNELEHASLLAAQGELDGAIALLKPLASARRPDPSVRRMLADLYYRQAESLLPSNRPAAVAALQRSVQTDPTHPKASILLKELNGPAAGTKAIPIKPSRQASP